MTVKETTLISLVIIIVKPLIAVENTHKNHNKFIISLRAFK